jgi:hypothetical protein
MQLGQKETLSCDSKSLIGEQLAKFDAPDSYTVLLGAFDGMLSSLEALLVQHFPLGNLINSLDSLKWSFKASHCAPDTLDHHLCTFHIANSTGLAHLRLSSFRMGKAHLSTP